MKKNYTFIAAVCFATAFVVGCSKNNDEPQPQHQNQTGQQDQNQTGQQDQNKNQEKQAVAKITTTGVEHTGAEVLFSETEDGTSVKGHAAIENRKVVIDVKNYIGKKLYFIVKVGNKIVSDVVEHTITEGDNAITITLKAIPVTAAKITVTKNGSPLQGEEVYLLDAITAAGFQASVAVGYDKQGAKAVLGSATKATTDAQGVANFTPAPGTYKAVVLGERSYQEVGVTVAEGQTKEATINLESLFAKITLTKDGQPLANTKVYFRQVGSIYAEKSDAQVKASYETMRYSILSRIIRGELSAKTINEVTTNAQGIVTCEDLEKDKRYIFLTDGGTESYKASVFTVDTSKQVTFAF
ncbi:hypothetical protein [uncultured Capnocytophaga sp.]|uniref:hypothetical protein n=1 Tax=uncultured Capnocytophaga sp. TaxID=159273 RepID=UPI00261CE659|nr:hypothetical protein [uncultured Capnocytophaga sp.]